MNNVSLPVQTRIVNVTKGGNEFASVPAIDDYLELVAGFIAAADWSTPDRGELAFTLARIYANLNHAHPFREGNGRTGTLFLHQLAALTPFRLDLSAVSVREWTRASRDSAPFRRSGEPSPRPLIPLFDGALVPGSFELRERSDEHAHIGDDVHVDQNLGDRPRRGKEEDPDDDVGVIPEVGPGSR